MALFALAAPSMALAQHRRVPARTVGHPHVQHTVLQKGGVATAGCGCGVSMPAPRSCGGCNTRKACCPPVIPAILNGLDRLVHCLLPCQRLGCGGCSSCSGRTYSGCNSCGGDVIHGEVIQNEIIVEPKAAAPAQNGAYYNRQGTVVPRYQNARTRMVPRPAPTRRTSVRKPTPKPAPRTRTASTTLKPVDARMVQLKPAPSKVRTVSYEAPAKRAPRNPLRD